MKVIGITGGIGSGKTLVSAIFHTLGIPVFDADFEAKKTYENNPELVQQLQTTFGENIAPLGILNKKRLAEIAFSDKTKLAYLNSLVHPYVARRFNEWKKSQRARLIIREAAILIESNSYKDCDHILLVSAPEEVKIQRVVLRSGLSEAQIRLRMAEQMTDEQRRPLCDFEIINDNSHLILPQIMQVYNKLRSEVL